MAADKEKEDGMIYHKKITYYGKMPESMDLLKINKKAGYIVRIYCKVQGYMTKVIKRCEIADIEINGYDVICNTLQIVYHYSGLIDTEDFAKAVKLSPKKAFEFLESVRFLEILENYP